MRSSRFSTAARSLKSSSSWQRLDVPRRIDRTFDVRHIWVVEGAGDEHERVGLTQMTEQRAAHPFLGDAFGDAGHVEILNVSRDPLLRAGTSR